MKAVVDQDIIVNLTDLGDTEIGTLPNGVGLERLRWDGTKIVDLADLTEMWVKNNSGSFELHCVCVPDSQLVQMTYSDRKNLVSNNGTIRLKTQEEINADNAALLLRKAKANLSNKLGDFIDLELAQLAFLCALIVYVRRQPAQLEEFLDSLVPEIIDTFPIERWESVLTGFARNLNQFINEYYDEIDQ